MLVNWAGNVTFEAASVSEPASIDELRTAVAAATAEGRPARAAGSLHSFSAIADPGPGGVVVSTRRLDRLVAIDHGAMTVTVEAGARYGELAAARRGLAPLLKISEIRTVAADDLWASTAQGRPTLALHFTWVNDEAAVMSFLPVLEAALDPFAARPHWGKLTAMPPELIAGRYPRWTAFDALRTE